jgi:hypothetical protein
MATSTGVAKNPPVGAGSARGSISAGNATAAHRDILAAFSSQQRDLRFKAPPPTATGTSSLPIDSNDVVRWQKRADLLVHMALAEDEPANVERFAKACLAAALAQVCMHTLKSEEQLALDALDVLVHEKQIETVNYPNAVAPKHGGRSSAKKGELLKFSVNGSRKPSRTGGTAVPTVDQGYLPRNWTLTDVKEEDKLKRCVTLCPGHNPPIRPLEFGLLAHVMLPRPVPPTCMQTPCPCDPVTGWPVPPAMLTPCPCDPSTG